LECILGRSFSENKEEEKEEEMSDRKNRMMKGITLGFLLLAIILILLAYWGIGSKYLAQNEYSEGGHKESELTSNPMGQNEDNNGAYNEPELTELQQFFKEGSVSAEEWRASNNRISFEHKWGSQGWKFSTGGSFRDVEIEFYRWRSRYRPYSDFVNDNEIISNMPQVIAREIERQSKEAGFSESQIALNVIHFIQSMPYTPDDVSTGLDEYPRFPTETLIDEGGDCEDTSILAATMLKEMGYGVVLITLPHHMAVGVRCDDWESTRAYYNYQGHEYCYLETTGENWDVGEIPEIYENQKVEILPV
jgi:hypothetical protein